MATFLLKTEPGEYSFDHLRTDGHTTWSGVKNNTALAHLRTARTGDHALIYHTRDQRAIVGLAQFVSNPYEDPAHPGLNNAGAPKLPVIDLKPLRTAKHPATLAQLKSDKRFAAFDLIRQSRLSVMPVPPELDRLIRTMTGL